MSQYSVTTRQTKDWILDMLAPSAKKKKEQDEEGKRVKWLAPVHYIIQQIRSRNLKPIGVWEDVYLWMCI